MKQMLIAGNWKMNTNEFEAVKLAEYISGGLSGIPKCRVLICPPFTNLSAVADVVKKTPIKLGAQNCHYEEKGAYTGEISVSMLSFLGCRYIITGHSERRAYFNETDEIINKKCKAVLDCDINCIVCIGETLEERNSSKTFDVLARQVNNGLNDIEPEYFDKLVIAYEPVWAIGTGITATVEQIAEAHTFIKNQLKNKLGEKAANIPVLYGGSVNAENAESILEIEDVNGALIGGASLKGDTFLSIINTADKILENEG